MVNQAPEEDVKTFVKQTERARNTPYDTIGLGYNRFVRDYAMDKTETHLQAAGTNPPVYITGYRKATPASCPSTRSRTSLKLPFPYVVPSGKSPRYLSGALKY